jgi:hypothetical protein
MQATVGTSSCRRTGATCHQEVDDAMWVTGMGNQSASFVRMTKILQSQQMVADSAAMTVVCHQTFRSGAADVKYPYVVDRRETSLVDRLLRPAVGLCMQMLLLLHRQRELRGVLPFDMVAYSRVLMGLCEI